jgi:DNA-directed RNA polymerase specialized sigma24 family protein
MGSRFLDFAQQTPIRRPEKLGSRVGFHPPVALFVSLSVKSLRELIENVLTRVLLFFGGLVMTTMSGDELIADADALPFLELHDELKQLERLDERAGMVVHFRFFLGMSFAEVAEALDISQKTVERDWSFARAWLRDRLKPTEIP